MTTLQIARNPSRPPLILRGGAYFLLSLCLFSLFPLSATQAKKTDPRAATARVQSISLSPQWKASLSGPKRSKGFALETASPTVSETRVFVGNTSGFFSAFDRANGKLLWKHNTGGPIEGPATLDGERLYVGNSKGILSSINAEDGALLWSTPLTDEILVSPIVHGNTLTVLTASDTLLTLDRETGERLRSTSLGTLSADLSLRGQGNPTVWGNTLFVPLTEGGVTAIDLSSGQRLFEQSRRTSYGRFSDSDISPLSSKSGLPLLFVGRYSDKVYALNAQNGTPAWETPLSAMSDFAEADGTLYVATSTGQLAALDSRTGAIKWERDFKDSSLLFTNPIVSGEHLIVGERSAGLYVLNRNSGEILGKASVPGGITGKIVPSSDTQTLYFLSNAHQLYAIPSP